MEDEDKPLELDHLTEREILIVACRDLHQLRKTVRGHGPRIRSLENWRIGLAAGWTALSGAVGLALAYLRVSPRNHP